MRTWHFFVVLGVALLAAHLCHWGVVWEPESLPMAAAKQMAMGKMLYRDIWYDKPPGAPLFSLMCGPFYRVGGAVYALLACVVAYLFARDLYERRAGFWAAGLLAFFLIFDWPVSVIPAGPDFLMLLPHLMAVYMAWSGRGFAAGLAAGFAFLCNAKGVFVLATCCLFGTAALGGFCLPVLIAADLLFLHRAFRGYMEQVWIWSSSYAANTPVAHAMGNGLARTGAWIGFHSALTGYWRVPWRLWIWLGLSLAGVALGWRFFPRYYLQLLAPAVVLSSGSLAGASLAGAKRWRYALLLLLLIPLGRFGPRYIELARHGDAGWSDTAMDRDSREASAKVRELAHAGDTMFVWGYRPEDWVYTGLRAATKYLDCQALTGVPADRHLTQSAAVTVEGTAAARGEVAGSKPEFVLDGLTAFNPALNMGRYPELAAWMRGYEEVGRTKFTVIYRRRGR